MNICVTLNESPGSANIRKFKATLSPRSWRDQHKTLRTEPRSSQNNGSVPRHPSASTCIRPQACPKKPYPRKIKRADTELARQFPNQLRIIEAARREPVHHQDRGLTRIPEARIKDLQRLPAIRRGGIPVKVLTGTAPGLSRIRPSAQAPVWQQRRRTRTNEEGLA